MIRIDTYRYQRINSQGRYWDAILYQAAGTIWFDYRGRLWFQTPLLALPERTA